MTSSLRLSAIWKIARWIAPSYRRPLKVWGGHLGEPEKDFRELKERILKESPDVVLLNTRAPVALGGLENYQRVTSDCSMILYKDSLMKNCPEVVYSRTFAAVRMCFDPENTVLFSTYNLSAKQEKALDAGPVDQLSFCELLLSQPTQSLLAYAGASSSDQQLGFEDQLVLKLMMHCDV